MKPDVEKVTESKSGLKQSKNVSIMDGKKLQLHSIQDQWSLCDLSNHSELCNGRAGSMNGRQKDNKYLRTDPESNRNANWSRSCRCHPWGFARWCTFSSTFTCSQGLLLMIPNMYKIAGELTPTVFISQHVLYLHALSIFGDHSDVMAVRSTGWAMLLETTLREAMDMALISHAATLHSRIPFLNVFDGFRTSHELSAVEIISDEIIDEMIDKDAVSAHCNRSLSPDHPSLKGTAQNPDVFFKAGKLQMFITWTFRMWCKPPWKELENHRKKLWDVRIPRSSGSRPHNYYHGFRCRYSAWNCGLPQSKRSPLEY